MRLGAGAAWGGAAWGGAAAGGGGRRADLIAEVELGVRVDRVVQLVRMHAPLGPRAARARARARARAWLGLGLRLGLRLGLGLWLGLGLRLGLPRSSSEALKAAVRGETLSRTGVRAERASYERAAAARLRSAQQEHAREP